MTRQELENAIGEAVRNNTSSPRVNLAPIQKGMYAIAIAVLFLGILCAPITLLACKALIYTFKAEQAIQDVGDHLRESPPRRPVQPPTFSARPVRSDPSKNQAENP